MDTQNLENTLKKMGLVLEKLVQKVDELDKRVAKLEGDGKKFSSGDFKVKPQAQTNSTSSSSSNTFSNSLGGSFLGSMAGAMAGMGLYNMLFNHNVTPFQMGESLGMNSSEINEVLQNDLNEIDSKLNEIDSKLEELDAKIDDVASDVDEDVMTNEYFESYEDEVVDNDFNGGFDDFEGLDDFDV